MRAKWDPGYKPAFSSWPVIIFWLIIFWPIGLFLLWRRYSHDRQVAVQSTTIIGKLSVFPFGLAALIFILNVATGGEEEMGGPIAFFAAMGFMMLWIAKRKRNNAERTKKYISVIVNQGERDLHRIAVAVNADRKQVIKDLQKMINIGYFRGAYVDLLNNRILIPGDGDAASSAEVRQSGEAESAATTTATATIKRQTFVNGKPVDPKDLPFDFDRFQKDVQTLFNTAWSVSAAGGSGAQASPSQQQSQGQQQAQPKERVARCKSCGANNKIMAGVGECEYCGSPL